MYIYRYAFLKRQAKWQSIPYQTVEFSESKPGIDFIL